MKSLLAVWCGMMSAALFAAPLHDVLVSREGVSVEKWQAPEAGNGKWRRVGVWLDGKASGVAPHGLAAADDIVYVGDANEGGRILRYSPEGRQLGVFLKLGFVPDQLCLSPDGKSLYVTRLTGWTANGLYRFAVADGAGGQIVSRGGLRTMEFGPDGLLYVGDRDTRAVRSYDVSGAKVREVGCFALPVSQGGFWLTGPLRTRLVSPAAEVETVDLVTGRSRRCQEGHVRYGFATARVGRNWVVGDFVKGEIFVRIAADGLMSVAGGVKNVCALVDLTDALNGTVRRVQKETAQALGTRHPGVKLVTRNDAHADWKRMKANDPSGTRFLEVGLWAFPMAIDWDGDGDLDLVVSCPDVPYNGTYLFENPTPKGQTCKMPVFKKAVKISDEGFHNVTVDRTAGRTVVLREGQAYWDFRHDVWEKPVKLGENLKANPHVRPHRGNCWRFVDWDGDGRDDLVAAIGSWTLYGWSNSYDEKGVWTNPPLETALFLMKNVGGRGPEAKYADPVELHRADGGAFETYGNPMPMFADWDGDGDLDMLCGSFIDDFIYFENTGTRAVPAYAKGRRLTGADGKRLCMDLAMETPSALDWDGDGDLDLICGDEDGRVAFIENTGRMKDGLPVFEQPQYFRQEADDLAFGALATPSAVDWDGDGDLDLISGNSAGYLAFIENLSGPGTAEPKWAEPRLLGCLGGSDSSALRGDGIVVGAQGRCPDTNPLRFVAGINGSIQGPVEREWGYSVLTAADWDGDGFVDIMANSIWGCIVWFRNPGKKGTLLLEPAREVEVEWNGEQPALDWGWIRPQHLKSPKGILTQWRTTPVMVDWNRDGLMDLVLLDHGGCVAYFERAKDASGKLILKAPRRAFVDEQGKPLQWGGNSPKQAGSSGRRKICVVDWDGDGRFDLVRDTGTVEIWLQTGTKNGNWTFRSAGYRGCRRLAGHTCCPTAGDFDGDGIPELVAGAEDGCFYWLQNERAQAREDPVDAYEVTVNGRPVTLHGADVEFLDWGEEYYFGSFDLAGPAEVRIRSKRPLDKTVILPAEKYGIKAKVSADEIVFTADRPFRISIEPDHRVKPLLLFANAPEKDAPKKGDPNVIWYGPGLHEAGLIRVGSNQTLYLADGAVVRGTVRAEGENITICGRGILDGGMYARWRGPVGWCINLTNCRKITLKDFIFRNPHSWSLSMIHCSDVLIENFKLCGSRQINDDAIDINNSQRVTIRDCFLRAQDDIFAIKGLESYGAVKTACEDIDISGCECWTDCANIFRIGYECNATAMRRIRARDLDVLHYARTFRPVEHFWANCIFFLQAAGGMPIEDVVVEDMRIHSSEYPCVMMSARPMKTRVHGKNYKSGGPIRNCTFRNVSVRGAEDFRGPVLIRGENENESVKGIVLENFTYNGKKLTASTPGVTVGPFAQAEIR